MVLHCSKCHRCSSRAIQVKPSPGGEEMVTWLLAALQRLLWCLDEIHCGLSLFPFSSSSYSCSWPQCLAYYLVRRNKTGKHNVQTVAAKPKNGEVNQETFRKTDPANNIPMSNMDSKGADPELIQHCRTTNPALKKNQYWVLRWGGNRTLVFSRPWIIPVSVIQFSCHYWCLWIEVQHISEFMGFLDGTARSMCVLMF